MQHCTSCTFLTISSYICTLLRFSCTLYSITGILFICTYTVYSFRLFITLLQCTNALYTNRLLLYLVKGKLNPYFFSKKTFLSVRYTVRVHMDHPRSVFTLARNIFINLQLYSADFSDARLPKKLQKRLRGDSSFAHWILRINC